VNPSLQLIRGACPRSAAYGTAVSGAILQRVAAGELPETARLGKPGRLVTFGRRDAVSAGYRAAVEAARSAGYDVVERIAGGRAAAYNASNPKLAPFARAAKSSWFVPTSPNWANVENANVLQDMLVKIFTGRASVKAAANTASSQITRILNTGA